MKKILCLSFVALFCATVFGQTGTFPVIFHNNTKVYADSQIYVLFWVQNKYWVDKNGVVQPFRAADVNAAGHYTKNGKNYAAVSVRLTDMVNFRCPTAVGGGRMYMSIGSPFLVNVSDGGFALPDPQNPGDPMADTYWDWYELAYTYNGLQFGGNTTQVDIFGFPYSVKVCQSSTHFMDSCGISSSSGWSMPKIMKLFKDSLSAPFQASIKPTRIMAPQNSSQFYVGGAYANYFKPYLDSLWADWTAKPFTFKYGGSTWTITGNGTDTVTVSGTNAGKMSKPTARSIWANNSFDQMSLNFVAPLSSALCRGVARDASWYNDPSTYYKKSKIRSEFADLLHRISIHNKAYGFGFDDNNNQSSVLIVGSSQPLDSLVIDFGSFEPLPTDGAIVPEQKSRASLHAILMGTHNIIVVQSASPIEKVTLVSLNGKSMRKSLQVNKNAFSIAGLSAGIYCVRITDKQGLTTTQKIYKE
jgi:hypothetical protein